MRFKQTEVVTRTVSALLSIVIVTSLLAARLPAQGSLSRARAAADDEPRRLPAESAKSSGSSSPSCDDNDRYRFNFGETSTWVIGMMLAAPWWGPHVMFDSGFHHSAYFPDHPYYDDETGYMMTSSKDWGTESPKSAATRFALEYGNNFADLQSVTGRLLWEHELRFGIDGELRFLHEELAVGSDQLFIGDLNFVYRFVQNKRLVMRSGIGINYMFDDINTEAGFNFTYGGDLFPMKPLVVSSEIDWGTLGDAEVFRWRGTVGAVWEHVEVYAGYQYYELDGVPLDGVMIGLRTWY